jgi:hypothetical protein
VKRGDVLATLLTSNDQLLEDAEKLLLSAYVFTESEPKKQPIIAATIY